MILNELKFPDDRVSAVDMLEKAGWNELGSGNYGSVFEKEGRKYVLKLFSSSDRAYIDFVKLVLENPNEHFPKFLGKLVKVTPNYCAIRMEKLTPIKNNFLIKYLQDYLYLSSLKKLDDMQKPVLITATKYVGRYKELQKACDLIIDNLLRKKIYFEDIHGKNVMMRDNVVVITDPVS